MGRIVSQLANGVPVVVIVGLALVCLVARAALGRRLAIAGPLATLCLLATAPILAVTILNGTPG